MSKVEFDSVIKEIVNLCNGYNQIKKVVLFGSRARGDNSERSDYDIAVYGDVPYSVQRDIIIYCSEKIWTLHKIDIVFVNEKLSAKMIANIEKEGKVLYEQT